MACSQVKVVSYHDIALGINLSSAYIAVGVVCDVRLSYEEALGEYFVFNWYVYELCNIIAMWV